MIPIFIIQGTVQEGKKRGRTLGYPTVNVTTATAIPDGIYISEVILRGTAYKAATFVGIAETFDETKRTIETYMLDFDQSIYGEEITIKIYKKLRDNKKFESADALIAQIHTDIAATREFFTDL